MNTNETTENFWQVWNSFVWPDPVTPTYRCYYLDTGDVDFYTMEDFPGNYIEIDQQTYVLAHKPARVVDGKLEIIKPKTIVQKLKPSITQGTQCHHRDVSVVVNSNGTYWNYQTNEIN
jgi:hypothetical protein